MKIEIARRGYINSDMNNITYTFNDGRRMTPSEIKEYREEHKKTHIVVIV